MAATEITNRWSEIADRLQPSGRAFIDGERVDARDGRTSRGAVRSTADCWPWWPRATPPTSTPPWGRLALRSSVAAGRGWPRASASG
jgi:hypothetical protein